MRPQTGAPHKEKDLFPEKKYQVKAKDNRGCYNKKVQIKKTSERKRQRQT